MMKKKVIRFVPQHEHEKLKEENADLAFSTMIAEGKAEEAKQGVADLEFQLMIGGII